MARLKEAIGRSGLKMSQLRTKQKTENPKGKRPSGEFPSMEETNFFDPKSLNMRSGRGSALPRRKEAPLEMEFGSVTGPKRPPPKRKSLSFKGVDPDEVY
jgi:hypothetical protein